jgi:drug/metabolite transporter (DMT)-like permease
MMDALIKRPVKVKKNFHSNRQSLHVALAFDSRISFYRLCRFPVGSVGGIRPGRIHRQITSRPGRTTAHRSADFVSDPHHIFLARIASNVGFGEGLATDQTSGSRCGILRYPGNGWRGVFELFLLSRHIQRTNVAIAIIVQYTAPVWVLIYVVARRQQKLTVQKAAAVALAITGIALVINLFSSRGAFRLDRYGILAALLASFSFAFYNVAGHGILVRHDRWRVLVWTLLAATFFWLVINPPWKIVAAHYAPAQWLFLFVFSMISVLGAFSLYFLGLQHLEPTRAIIASCLEPVFSILLAALLLGEVLRPIQTVGIVFVLAAIVIVQRPDRSTSAQGLIVEPME